MLAVAFGAGACSDGTGPDGDPAPDGWVVASSAISRVALDVRPNPAPPLVDFMAELLVDPRNPYRALVRVQAGEPVRVQVHVSGPGARMPLVQPEMTGPVVEVPIFGLRAGSRYALRAVAFSTLSDARGEAELELTTAGAPPVVPQPVLTEDMLEEDHGLVLFGVARSGSRGRRLTYVGVDHDGEVVWMADDTEAGGASPGFIAGVIEPVGTDRLFTAQPNEWRVIDANGVVHASFPDRPEYGGAYHHHATMLPNGNLAALSWETPMVDVPELGGLVTIRADVLLEIAPGGAVVARLAFADFLDETRFPGPFSRMMNTDGTINWSHGNSVEYREEDDSYLVSLRNQGWIVKVDRATNTVEWVLGEGGDFALEGGGEWFNGQHSAKWVPGTSRLTVMDNGAERDAATGFSRAVAYEVDEVRRVARVVRDWRLPYRVPVQGDVDELENGHWLVSGAGLTPEPVQTIFEIDTTGQVVWSLELPMEQIFQAVRVPSLPVP